MDDGAEFGVFRRKRKAGHQFKQGADDTLVNGHECGFDAGRTESVEPTSNPFPKRRPSLAAWKGEFELLLLPLRIASGVNDLDLLRSQPLPIAEIDLSKIRLEMNSAAGRENPRRLPGSAKRACPTAS